jgi:hypothetical protein
MTKKDILSEIEQGDDGLETMMIGGQPVQIRRVDIGTLEQERLDKIWEQLAQNNGALAGLTGQDLLSGESD